MFLDINVARVSCETGELIVRLALDPFREVELSLGAFEPQGGVIVRDGCVLGGVERPEPNPGRLLWVSDLGSPFPPRSLPDSSIMLFPNSI